MKNKIKQQRLLAVQRFRNGESPNSICASLGKSKAWLYKWIERSLSGDDSWSKSQSRRPLSNPVRTPTEVEEVAASITRIYSAALRQSGGSWKIWE